MAYSDAEGPVFHVPGVLRVNHLHDRLPMTRISPRMGSRALLSIAVAIGLGLPLLSLLRGAGSRALPYTHPYLADEAPDWHAMWTSDLTVLADVQDRGFEVLLRIAVAFTVLLVLLAMVNAVVSLVVRGGARRHGIVMQMALGAPRMRLASRLVGEAGVLVMPALAAGVLIAAVAGWGADRSWPYRPPPWGTPTVDWAVAAFLVGAFLLVVLACWAMPVGVAWRRNLAPHLGSGARSTPGPAEGLGRSTFIVLQVAVCLTVLVTAGSLLEGFLGGSGRQAGVPAGGETVLVGVRLPGDMTGSGPRSDLLEEVQRSVGLVPGVVDTSVASVGARSGIGHVDVVHALTGIPELPGVLRRVYQHAVGPGYFVHAGSPPIEGREFSFTDRLGSNRVVIVNRTFAERALLSNAVGKQVQLGRPGMRGELYTVIGVVPDHFGETIGVGSEPVPAIYLSALQHPPGTVQVSARVSGDPIALAPLVEDAVAAAHPAVGVAEAITLDRYLRELRAPLGWFGIWLALLALATLSLAVLGVYDTLSYDVLRRTREIGIRMAIGASPRAVTRMVMSRTLRLFAVGSLLGMIGAVTMIRLLHYHFKGIEPFDPMLLGSTAAILGVVALIASYGPAIRAAGGDPRVALRME
jgi:putative ABC transport system permease protein